MAQPEVSSRLPILIAVGFLVVFGVIFVVELIGLSGDDGGLVDEDVTADAYAAELDALLVEADPAQGPAVLTEHGCNACHGNGLAPDYETVRAMAAERRSPMSARAYIYESILYPGAYLVDNYPNNMPRVYGDSVPAEDLAHMVVYLAGDFVATADEDDGTAAEAAQMPAGSLPEPVELTDERVAQLELETSFVFDGADPDRGSALLEEYGCNACHGEEAAGIVAPGHADVAAVAAERRPPLSAAAYVYEAIVYPDHYIVPEWPNSMPKNYGEMIPARDLGDIIAYLLQGAA